MSLNDILFSYNTSGATKETAAQDGLTEVGIAASQKMAKTDLPKLLKFAAAFKKAGQKYGLPPALLAAIASRETRGGSQLRANGFGSNGEDFGLMQVNQKSHVLQGSAFSEAHINQATGILKSYYEQVADKHPTWTRPQQLRGAVAAYNFGVSNVRTLEGMDHRTANNDYSSDIWARAQTLAPHFQESPSGVKEDAGPKNGKQTSGVTSASGSQAGQNETLVTELQKLLVKHGYMNARQVQTGPGILGPQTKAALAKFLADKARTPVSNEPVPAPGKSQEPVVNLPTKEVAQLADVPLYNQGDTRWAGEFLQKNLKIGPKGCALTATAMAISKTSGQPINPLELDKYLDGHGGYVDDCIVWDVAARAVGLRANVPGWSLQTIDKELAAGRPVVVGVDYKGDASNDHWVTIIGKVIVGGAPIYTAHDPALGRKFSFRVDGVKLRASYSPKPCAPGYDTKVPAYVTTGLLRTFYPPAPKKKAVA